MKTKITMEIRAILNPFLLKCVIVNALLFGSLLASVQGLPPERCSECYLNDNAHNLTAREWFCWGDKSANNNSTLEKNSLRVYPNPATDLVTIQLKEELQNANLELMDAQGKTYMSTNISGSTSSMDVSQLSSGVYWLRVGKDGELLISSFTIKK